MTANALTGYVPNPQIYGTNSLAGVAPPNTVTGAPAAGQRPTSGQYAGMSAEDILGYMRRNGWTQDGVNTVYAMRNLGTPPTVPANLEGVALMRGRGGVPVGANGRPITGYASAIPFLDTVTRQAEDPFRHYGVGNWLGVAGMIAGTAGAAGLYGAPAAAGGSGAAAGAAAGEAGGTGAGLGIFSNGGTAGLAGVGGGSAGALAASGGIAGGAGIGGTTAGALGGASGIANGISGVGSGGSAGAGAGMGWGDWINLAGQVAGAVAQSRGASNASNAEQAGIKAGIDEQRRQFDLSRADQAPWVASGTAALNRLNDPNAFTQSPGYAFTRDEALKGVENSASAKGGLYSGNAGRALQDRAGNLASQDYGNWFNQNASLAGLGQTSAQSLGALGQNNANNVSNLLNQQGNARASGIEGQTNALTGGIGDFLSWYNRRRQGGG